MRKWTKLLALPAIALSLLASGGVAQAQSTPWNFTTAWHNAKFPGKCLSAMPEPILAAARPIGTKFPVIMHSCDQWDQFHLWTTKQIGDNRFLFGPSDAFGHGVDGCVGFNLLSELDVWQCSATEPREVWSVTGTAAAGYRWKSEFAQTCMRVDDAGWGPVLANCDSPRTELNWIPEHAPSH
ncbi:hypothetical protein [Actinocrispum wychmicini]|uniref:Uncharacterized protein n=1 Tax=Actinocrispum wychmicini TaxID=1213861 RepID=A0A4R2JRQ5_9PSEU|nr:hypothetical protein [Actinocrispum wychmicini]TCO62224.1 hypothetical protein EV192_102361 [Actinocrispum wychmicini]